MTFEAITSRVHGALEELGSDCPMEEVAALCPEFTWNQVFLAIDYLSRAGRVRVTLDSARTYRVAACHAAATETSCVSPGP